MWHNVSHVSFTLLPQINSIDSPAEMNPSIFSLKGWRNSSDGLAQIFCMVFSQAGGGNRGVRRERY